MQIWIHDNKMKKIVALNNDIPDMLSYTNSSWHSYLDQATSTFDFTIPKFSNGELHEDLKLINDECFVSFYVNGSYQVFYIATLQEDDFNIQLTCNNTNLEYALEYANPFNSNSAQSIQWYLEHMDLLSFAAVEIGNNEISDRKRTLTFDSQETKMNRLQSLMSKFEAEFEFKVELNRDGTYKRIVINIYQEADDTHHGIGTDRKDVVLYYSNGLKGVQVTSDKTQMFNAGVFDGKDGVNLANVEFSEKNADGVEEFYSRKGDIFVYAPLSMQRYPATMRPDGQDNWIRKDFQTEYENVNDLKAYALRTLKKYAYPLVTYTASVQSGFVSHYTDLKLGDTIRIIDKNFVGGLALEARVSEMIISFDNPANNSFVFTNYRKLDNKPSSALQTRIEQAVESKLPYRIELATTGGVTFKNNEGETIVKPSLYKGNLPYTKDVSWRWALDGVSTVGTQYSIQARDITGTEVLTVAAYVGNLEVATTEITLTNVDDGVGVESIDRYFTSSDQSDGVTIEGAEWSDKPPAPTEDGKYLWAYDEITYTDGTVTTTKPAAVGANFDVNAFRAEIAEDLKDVPNREEFENKIAEELANSKAEIETQIETAKTQAESNAKEYADTINQETAKVAELANAAADEIKSDLVNVKNNLTDTSLVANNAQAAVDAAKQELTEVANELSTAKQDLTNSVAEVNTKVNSTKAELTQAKTDLISHAQQLQTQANAQTELSKRVTTVETTANGTKTTVSELSKTVAQNGKDITSVTARTKTVEDDLTSTKTTLSQVQTTANSTSQKTATLETGLNGLTAKFNSLSVGNKNYLPTSRVVNRGCNNFSYSNTTKSWTMTAPASSSGFGNGITFNTNGLNILLNGGETLFFGLMIKANKACSFNYDVNNSLSGATSNDNDDTSKRAHSPSNKSIPANVWTKVWFSYTAKANVAITENNSNFGIVNNTEPVTIEIKEVMVAKSNVPVDYQTPDADVEQKIAEYKQNADQNYASLQSNLQTLDGTVRQNKTEFDQTASQIKSSISSVEGKIPTNVSTRNLILKSNDFTNPHKQNGANTTITSTDGYFVIKSTGYTSNSWGGMSWNMSISEVKAGEEFSILMPVYIDSSVALDNGWGFALKNHPSNLAAYYYDIPTNKKDQWFNVAITFKAFDNVVFDTYPFYVYLNKNGLVRIKPPMLVRGNLIPRDYQPAFEDAASDITKLNTTLTQTANGLEQLSTQVTSQGSTITSHTNSINSLATGLQAKVSQSDFNTLSGRVTTAENNITAKANELSSKITSVEGKIPTSVGGRNYIKDSEYRKASIYVNDNQSQDEAFNISPAFWQNSNVYNKKIKLSFYYQASVAYGTERKFPVYFRESPWPWIGEVTYPANTTRPIKYTMAMANTLPANFTAPQIFIRFTGNLDKGRDHIITKVMLEVSDVFSDWQPAPEDTASQISSLSSELKQTKDGITLLATKTELSTAKNELQSGINTATNKANNAQNTANNNAQTINTHTTQISALNTGLQAKVSQSEFNTLSGRVTTAENNITAKANELSSKITSVEGKIPTNVSTRNLILKSNDFTNPHKQNGANTTITSTDGYFVIKSTGYTSNSWGGMSWNMSISEVKAGEEFSILMPVYIDSSVALDNGWGFALKNHPSNLAAYYYDIPTNKKDQWFNVAITFKAFDNVVFDTYPFYVYLNKNGLVRIKPPMLVRGNLIPRDYQPAFEDAATQINTLSSEFKQTTDAIKASVSSLDKSTVKSSSLTINSDGIVMKAGKSTTDVANAIGSYFSVNQNAINLFSDKINVKGNMIVSGAITSDKIASKSINTAHLNGKIITADVISSNAVTADAIKAGAVTTDKMSANSINGDRITAGTLDAAKIKAGSISASQIASGTLTSAQIKAGAIKSINIEASAITSDKIAANSISSDKIVASGITANVIKGGTLQSLNGSTNFELDSGKLFYNNNNTGVFRVQNGASTMGLKFSNTSISVNGTSRILSRTILGGDRRETTLDDGKWDKGGFSGIVIETIKGVEPAVNEHADALRAISDTIYFTHTYSADSPTGVSAHGWKMETYAPNSSYSGNIVLKPYGINYRQSDIIVGDVRLDNGDGSGYWMRATINVLKACFGHILNGGLSSDALNAIRSELNKISGT